MRLAVVKTGRWLRIVLLLAAVGMVAGFMPAVVSAVTLGEEFGGGIVVAVDSTGQHGLIASKVDLPGHSPDVSEEGLFTSDDARKGCDALVKNGFDDWILPSREQLTIVYQRKESVGGFAVDGGNYWSVTEESPGNPWFQYFGSGNGVTGKVVHCRVRPVRPF